MVCSSESERVGRKVWWTVGKQVSKTILHTELDWSELCQSGERGREILEFFRVGRNRGICLQPSFSRHVYGKQTREQDHRLNAHKENWFYSRGPDNHRRQQRSDEESWHQSVLKYCREEKKGNNLQAKGNPERQLVQGPVKAHADVKK